MNIKIWCKSFLSIYNLVPTIVASIDRLVLLKSTMSSNFSLSPNNSTFNQANSILALTQKKVCLINLKVITDETLLLMNEKKSKILVLRYIDGVSGKELIEVLKMSRRTYFRTIKACLKEFESIFYRNLLQSQKVFDSLDEKLFDEIFFRIDTFEKKKVQEDLPEYKCLNEHICSFVVNKIKSVI